MSGLRIGISTQTPLLRFHAQVVAPSGPGASRPVTVPGLEQRIAGELTPGGVCRMVLPTLKEWDRTGWMSAADWFSLQLDGPPEYVWPDFPLTLRHIRLRPDELAAYARTKEKLWADIHGLPSVRFDREDFRFYARYNWITSDELLARSPPLDLVYVHDFQLLQVGAILGLAAPTVFRWHVPFSPALMPKYTRNFVTRAMEDFDMVVVSTRRDLEGLVNAGFHGRAYQLYPHVDTAALPNAEPAKVEALDARWRLEAADPVVLCVARMDPMKRQDLAIRAMARIRRRHPRARLVLVGNGSFSSDLQGGLGLSKSYQWLAHLRALATELGMARRVVFAGRLNQDDLAAAYHRASLVVLPSDIEGFGIVALEAWRYSRPAVVSSGTGASEVVQDGLSGRIFPAGGEQELADAIDELLGDPDQAARMGQAGRLSLRNHDAAPAARQEARVLEEAMRRFGGGR